MEKNLVKIVGRAEVLGRPMLYGTTRRFLEVFGLGSLRDLPRVDELKGGAPKEPADPQEESAEEGEQDDEAKERANAAEPSPADDAGPEQAAPEGQYEPATPNSADSVMHEPDEAEFDDDDEDLDEDDELETA
jgi:segregation and condensation protein B